MGQQQLLLIVLGVIVVGIAIVVGINLFNANAESSNKDAITADCTNLGVMAQQYYKKPVSMGGGGNAFDASNGGTGWSIPPALLTTANGSYHATVGAQSVTITGTPLSTTGYTWHVTTTVTPTSLVTSVSQ
jgi:hypothetical protein